MSFSYLLINVGKNPDRPGPGRLWLRNLYHVHQRLCMAFPSGASRISNDAEFLPSPMCPRTLRAKQVHVERATGTPGFLLRIDPQAKGRPRDDAPAIRRQAQLGLCFPQRRLSLGGDPAGKAL